MGEVNVSALEWDEILLFPILFSGFLFLNMTFNTSEYPAFTGTKGETMLIELQIIRPSIYHYPVE